MLERTSRFLTAERITAEKNQFVFIAKSFDFPRILCRHSLRGLPLCVTWSSIGEAGKLGEKIESLAAPRERSQGGAAHARSRCSRCSRLAPVEPCPHFGAADSLRHGSPKMCPPTEERAASIRCRTHPRPAMGFERARIPGSRPSGGDTAPQIPAPFWWSGKAFCMGAWVGKSRVPGVGEKDTRACLCS